VGQAGRSCELASGKETDPEEKLVEEEARQCAGLFQRSSSCVEGRNGRLSLFHHGQKRSSEERLKALTAVHNYMGRREDGKAAERFFGAKQRDAFAWLLQRLPDRPRPAAKPRKQGSDEAERWPEITGSSCPRRLVARPGSAPLQCQGPRIVRGRASLKG